MTGLFRTVCFAGLAFAARAAAAADPGHAEGAGLTTLVAQIFNVLVLVAVLVYFARKPIQGFFQKRSRDLAGEIDRAEARVRDAEAELANWQQRLERFEAEARRIVDMTSELAATERDQLVERAEAAAARIREEAGAAVEREIERARGELRAEAAELATELAAEQVRAALTPDDDRRLLSEFSERIRSNGRSAQ